MIIPKIKICGIKTLADAQFCEQLKVDAIGLVFYKKSPRFVNIKTAQQIVNNMPPFITVVGLFANAEYSEVAEVLSQVKLDCLQFHGEETDEFCQQFNKKWFKAIRVQQSVDIAKEIEKYPNSSAILLDSCNPKIQGGSGEAFNWNIVPSKLKKPLILAGGLNSQNVQSAVKIVQPWALDISSGVESSKGMKSQEMIGEFVNKTNELIAD